MFLKPDAVSCCHAGQFIKFTGEDLQPGDVLTESNDELEGALADGEFPEMRGFQQEDAVGLFIPAPFGVQVIGVVDQGGL